MLNKLLKYDLKWIYKVVVIFYILALVFSIFTRIFTSIDNSILFNIVGHICSGFAIGMMISSLINAMMRLWVRFIRNIYKDESYLTHTLPISKKTIYLSKVLTGIICIFTTVIVSIVCLFICFYSKGNMQILKSLLELAASTYDTTVINLLLIISLVLFLEILFILLVGYTGIIIGHKRNKNKMMYTLIGSFIMYLGTQGITLLIIYIFGLFNKNVMNVINTTDIVNVNAIKTIMYLGIIIYAIYDIIYYFVGKKELENGVNVD